MTPEPFETETRDDGVSWGLIVVLLLAIALPLVYMAIAVLA